MIDFIIIGGGIVGASMAYELAKYQFNVTLLEKETELSFGVSKSNSGIIHTGFQDDHNSLKGKFAVRGNQLYREMSKLLDFPFIPTGELVVAFPGERESIEQIKENGERLDIPGLEILDEKWLDKNEPMLSKEIECALLGPTAAVINPYEVIYAMAENALWGTTYCKQVTQYFNHLLSRERTRDFDRQALTRKFVDHHEHTNLPSVLESIGHEVIRPNMVFVLGTMTYAAILTTASRQTPLSMLFFRHLHVLLLPDALNPLVIHTPAQCFEQRMCTRTAKSRATIGNASHCLQQLSVSSGSLRLITLGSSRLTEYTAGSTFCNLVWPQTATHFRYCAAPSLGAQKFPLAASFNIALSSAWSATSFFSRAFSFWRALSSLDISGCILPYFCRQR